MSYLKVRFPNPQRYLLFPGVHFFWHTKRVHFFWYALYEKIFNNAWFEGKHFWIDTIKCLVPGLHG